MDSVLLDHSQSAEKRIQACFQLLRETSDDAILQLIKGLRMDPSPIVRHECAYSLGEMTSNLGTDALVEAIYKDPNSFVKHEAALAVSNLGQGREAIEHLLDHPDPDVVATAEISYRRYIMKQENIRLHDAPEKILLNLSEHPEHRIQASFSLLEDNSESSIDILLQALEQETNPIVKHEIIFCLGEVASNRVVPSLITHMLRDDNVFVKHEAALALATLGEKDAADAIQKLMDHYNPDVVESAEIALDRLLSPQ